MKCQVDSNGCWITTGQRSNGKTIMVALMQRVNKDIEEEYKANNSGRQPTSYIGNEDDLSLDVD